MTGMKDAQRVTGAAGLGLAGAADTAALFGDLPETACFEIEPARRFVENAVQEYQKCLASRDANGVPSHLPRASGLLFGRSNGTEITISDIEFVPELYCRQC